MSSGFKAALATVIVVAAGGAAMDYAVIRASDERKRLESPEVVRVPVNAPYDERGELRVCADPNNMPFSNVRREGFENALAEIVARELGWKVSYTWWPQRRGFIRNTLAAKTCDVVMGVPADYGLAETTRPYYRSTYVFVTRRDDGLRLASFNDPKLKQLTIGLHTIGDDYNNVPPAQMLAMHGIVNNVRGYSIYGDYSRPDPPRDLIDAVANGEIDVAIAWGPLAGFFAGREEVPLDVQPVADGAVLRALPMQFDIAMAVRRGDDNLRSTLDAVLAARGAEIAALLVRYHIPTVQARAQRVANIED